MTLRRRYDAPVTKQHNISSILVDLNVSLFTTKNIFTRENTRGTKTLMPEKHDVVVCSEECTG